MDGYEGHMVFHQGVSQKGDYYIRIYVGSSDIIYIRTVYIYIYGA